ncbi:TonB-dependent receptor [Caulobacter flavus]|uniref:TonB-dependent receptor n=1 Tax=Caulobacter flavus TaxID=1679497 RepID=A0A2N5CQZ9_9CAUL|nr:TonB-dependent receptor [Caulobacter flavus]AYV45584.1 TonB-dependent receptor [Caulobacter flavus]PLR10624.1 TonB-dependent receptor [Caulobacter flavus]
MNTKKIACLASTALVGSLLAATAAMAQSTGTDAVEAVVVTASGGPKAVAGVIAETAPKSKVSITQEAIATQASGQTIFQSLNQIPGVSFTNNDPYGSSGGNLRLRGFDGNRVSVTFDGIPLNDTGNYAVYPNQMLDPELISRASVNLGTTDVDSPTASATGGTINYVTARPTKDFGGVATASLGSFGYHRGFLQLNTGEFGPWGTTAWISGSYQSYDKWKGKGELEKKQFNARVFQDLGNGDFVSLAAHYNINRNNNYRQMTMAEYRAFGRRLDFTDTCVNRTLNTTTGSITVAPPTVAGNCSDFYGRQVNPSNTGNIRGSGKFHLADNLIWTIDPSFQYTLADGGSQLGTISETDLRVLGTSNVGKDLNGNGTTTDTVAFFTPSVTNTRRYMVTSSVIWQASDTQRFRVAYTGDYGRHRQTGEYTFLNPDGTTTNVFGGKDGHGKKVFGSDGSFLRARDRYSVAQLNQISADYFGQFLESKLTVNLGLRVPYFERQLNQFCYTSNSNTTSSGIIAGFNAFCTTRAPAQTNADGSVQFANGAGVVQATKYIKPFSLTKKYDDVLPNVGVTYALADNHTVYAAYAEGFSSPRTDNLYTVSLVNGQVATAGVEPETTKSIDVGYRYTTPNFVSSVALWKTDYSNRIVSSYDQDQGISIDRNVGDVKSYGLDAQASWQVAEYLRVSGSFSYNHSEIQDDFRVSSSVVLPTGGKAIVETPEYTWGGRVDWNITENLKFGVQAKYTGERWATDVNDEKTPSYSVIDLDLRYDLPFAERTYVQANVTNLFDEVYFGSISSRNTANGVVTSGGTFSGSAPSYHIGAPRTYQVTLRTQF